MTNSDIVTLGYGFIADMHIMAAREVGINTVGVSGHNGDKAVQFARKPHAVNTLQREGEHLGVEGSMLEIVRPVLELLWVSWALGRDGKNSFLNPGHSQV